MNGNRMAEKLVESIRRICREKGVSIMQMESDLGFSAGLISRWNKTKTCPSFDKIVDIMDYLEITYDELMDHADSFHGEKQEKPSDNEDEDKLIKELEMKSISGDFVWEKAAGDMPFKVVAETVFQNMFSYDMHRIYYAAYGKGWILFSVQYSEETTDVSTSAYMITAESNYTVRLNSSGEGRMRLLKVIDEEIFNRINQDQLDKMKADIMGEEFQSRYRRVS